jgi:hypothetical protein
MSNSDACDQANFLNRCLHLGNLHKRKCITADRAHSSATSSISKELESNLESPQTQLQAVAVLPEQPDLKKDAKCDRKRKWNVIQLNLSEKIPYREQCFWTFHFDIEKFDTNVALSKYLLQNNLLPKEVFKISYPATEARTEKSLPILFFTAVSNQDKASIGLKIVQSLDFKKQRCSLGYQSFVYCKQANGRKTVCKVPYSVHHDSI